MSKICALCPSFLNKFTQIWHHAFAPCAELFAFSPRFWVRSTLYAQRPTFMKFTQGLGAKSGALTTLKPQCWTFLNLGQIYVPVPTLIKQIHSTQSAQLKSFESFNFFCNFLASASVKIGVDKFIKIISIRCSFTDFTARVLVTKEIETNCT